MEFCVVYNDNKIRKIGKIGEGIYKPIVLMEEDELVDINIFSLPDYCKDNNISIDDTINELYNFSVVEYSIKTIIQKYNYETMRKCVYLIHENDICVNTRDWHYGENITNFWDYKNLDLINITSDKNWILWRAKSIHRDSQNDYVLINIHTGKMFNAYNSKYQSIPAFAYFNTEFNKYGISIIGTFPAFGNTVQMLTKEDGEVIKIIDNIFTVDNVYYIGCSDRNNHVSVFFADGSVAFDAYTYTQENKSPNRYREYAKNNQYVFDFLDEDVAQCYVFFVSDNNKNPHTHLKYVITDKYQVYENTNVNKNGIPRDEWELELKGSMKK